jgi:hypothetical protein
VKNEVLHGVKEKGTSYVFKKRTSNWIGHILRRSCLLQYLTDEKIGRFGKRRKKM